MISKIVFFFFFQEPWLKTFWANIDQPAREIEGEFKRGSSKVEERYESRQLGCKSKNQSPPCFCIPYKLFQCCRPSVSSFNNLFNKYSLYTSQAYCMIWATIWDWHFTPVFLDYSLWWAIFSSKEALSVYQSPDIYLKLLCFDGDSMVKNRQHMKQLTKN